MVKSESIFIIDYSAENSEPVVKTQISLLIYHVGQWKKYVIDKAASCLWCHAGDFTLTAAETVLGNNKEAPCKNDVSNVLESFPSQTGSCIKPK